MEEELLHIRSVNTPPFALKPTTFQVCPTDLNMQKNPRPLTEIMAELKVVESQQPSNTASADNIGDLSSSVVGPTFMELQLSTIPDTCCTTPGVPNVIPSVTVEQREAFRIQKEQQLAQEAEELEREAISLIEQRKKQISKKK
jgi:hypothetical protein